MAKFTVEHGKSTELKTPLAKPQGFGGGLFRSSSEYFKLPDRYELLMDTTEDVQRLLDTAGSVLGSSEEIILEQLESRHPCPIPGGSYLWDHDWTVEKVENEKTYSGRRRRYRTGQHKTSHGWLVMDRPVLQFADLSALQDITLKHGAVLIPAEQVEELLGTKENIREAGFTIVDRRFDLVQVNFNPNYMRLAKYRARVQKYEERISAGFPTLAVYAFYQLMTPKCGPANYGVLTVDKEEHAGANDVVCLWKTAKKFWGPFWREDKSNRVYVTTSSTTGRGWGRGRYRGGGESQNFTFEQALQACLPYLHAEEKEKRWLNFCKFLRAEARAFGVKIPPAPREPKKPKFKRRKPIRRSKHEVEQSRLAVAGAAGLLRTQPRRDGTAHPPDDSAGGAVPQAAVAAAN